MALIKFGTDKAQTREIIGEDSQWSWKRYEQNVANANVEMIEGDFTKGLGQGVGIAAGVVGLTYLIGKMLGK